MASQPTPSFSIKLPRIVYESLHSTPQNEIQLTIGGKERGITGSLVIGSQQFDVRYRAERGGAPLIFRGKEPQASKTGECASWELNGKLLGRVTVLRPKNNIADKRTTAASNASGSIGNSISNSTAQSSSMHRVHSNLETHDAMTPTDRNPSSKKITQQVKDTLRERLVHFLAYEPIDEAKILSKARVAPEIVIEILGMIGKKAGQKWALKAETYREVQVATWPKYRDAVRAKVIRNGLAAFESIKLPVDDSDYARFLKAESQIAATQQQGSTQKTTYPTNTLLSASSAAQHPQPGPASAAPVSSVVLRSPTVPSLSLPKDQPPPKKKPTRTVIAPTLAKKIGMKTGHTSRTPKSSKRKTSTTAPNIPGTTTATTPTATHSVTAPEDAPISHVGNKKPVANAKISPSATAAVVSGSRPESPANTYISAQGTAGKQALDKPSHLSKRSVGGPNEILKHASPAHDPKPDQATAAPSIAKGEPSTADIKIPRKPSSLAKGSQTKQSSDRSGGSNEEGELKSGEIQDDREEGETSAPEDGEATSIRRTEPSSGTSLQESSKRSSRVRKRSGTTGTVIPKIELSESAELPRVRNSRQVSVDRKGLRRVRAESDLYAASDAEAEYRRHSRAQGQRRAGNKCTESSQSPHLSANEGTFSRSHSHSSRLPEHTEQSNGNGHLEERARRGVQVRSRPIRAQDYAITQAMASPQITTMETEAAVSRVHERLMQKLADDSRMNAAAGGSAFVSDALGISTSNAGAPGSDAHEAATGGGFGANRGSSLSPIVHVDVVAEQQSPQPKIERAETVEDIERLQQMISTTYIEYTRLYMLIDERTKPFGRLMEELGAAVEACKVARAAALEARQVKEAEVEEGEEVPGDQAMATELSLSIDPTVDKYSPSGDRLHWYEDSKGEFWLTTSAFGEDSNGDSTESGSAETSGTRRKLLSEEVRALEISKGVVEMYQDMAGNEVRQWARQYVRLKMQLEVMCAEMNRAYEEIRKELMGEFEELKHELGDKADGIEPFDGGASDDEPVVLDLNSFHGPESNNNSGRVSAAG